MTDPNMAADIGCEFDPKITTPSVTAICPGAPYNTGKVVIGSHYERPRHTHMTSEGEFWQSVLLGIHHEKRKQRRYMVLYVLALLMIFALLMGMRTP